jgi:tripeptide aminopeptidase
MTAPDDRHRGPRPVGVVRGRDAIQMRDLLAELCLVPSPSRSERAIADDLVRRFEALGASVFEDDAAVTTDGTAGNMIAVLPGGLPRRIALAAHMDTVPLVEGEPLDVVRDGSKLRSTGNQILGADDKAGVAIVLELVERMSLVTHPDRPTVVAVITVCEEIGLVGARHLDVAALDSDFGFSFDGEVPVGELITRAVYKEAVTLTVRGRRSHAALEPELGIHAIHAAAEVVRTFPLGRTGPDLVANIGSIRGGGSTNVVPDLVTLEAEARAFSPERLEELLSTIEHAARAATGPLGASVDIARRRLYDGYDLPDTAEPCRLLAATAPSHGIRPRFVASIGGSDTNILNQKGLPTVNVGVNMHDIHSVAEWIDAADLALVADWLTDALLVSHDLSS